MSKVGFSKAKEQNTTINQEGELVYSISNPAQLLIASAAYMGEPRFYPSKAVESSKDFNDGVLDDKGTNILRAAIQLAQASYPEKLLCIAKWARTEMNMRLFPMILLAAGVKFIHGSNETQNPVSKYIPHICTRPDDLLQLLALYNALFGSFKDGHPKAKLPNSLRRGMSYALMSYSDYQLIKYRGSGSHPSFKDLILAIRGGMLPKRYRSKAGFPLSKPMFQFMVNNRVTDDAPRILQARKEFFALAKNDDLEIEPGLEFLIKEAGLTWENVVSALSSHEDKQKVWSLAFKLMPYMATLRNLRNGIEHKVDNLQGAVDKVVNPENVRSGKQLPFRYFTAYKAISELDHCENKRKILESMEGALKVSLENLPKVQGSTAIFLDNSGSMGCPLSEKSSVNLNEIANLMGAIFFSLTDNSLAFPFGSTVHPVTLLKTNSLFQNAKEIGLHVNEHGHGTNAGECVSYLIRNRIKVDRIIIVSDLQTYGSVLGGSSFQTILEDYRTKINKDVWLHSIDLEASQTSIARPTSKVNLLGGYSEKIINLIVNAETKSEPKELNSLAAIIKAHRVTQIISLPQVGK